MASDPTPPRAPRGLGTSGRALWRSVTKATGLDAHELIALAEACRLADMAADLEAVARERGLTYQAVAEVRKLRSAVATMVRDLAPSGDGLSTTDMARKLAQRRTHTGRSSS